MTLSSTANRVAYAGDGTTTLFAVPFVFFANAHIAVTLRDAAGGDAPWAEHTHYTLAGAGQPGGGTLTVKTAPANHTPPAGSTLTIRRVVPLTQETDYVENDPFPAAAHERALDLAAMRDQQLQEQIDRTLRFPVTDTAPIPELPSFATRANKYLGFDGDGDPTLFSTLLDIQQSVAEGGTAPRLLTEHFGDALDVRDFGCKGDGATDDTANFQAALNYADANARRLLVPDGTYLVGPLTIDGPMALELSPKATLRLKNGANASLLAIAASDVTVRGGTLDGNRANVTNATGIIGDGCHRLRVEDVHLKSCIGYGLRIEDADDVTIRNCWVEDTGGTAIQFFIHDADMRRCLIENCFVDRSANNDNNSGIVFSTTSSTGKKAYDCRVQNSRVHLHASGTGLCIEFWAGSERCAATDNHVRGGEYGISFNSVRGGIIVGNTVFDCNFIGLELADGNYSTIADNTVDGNGAQSIGILVTGAPTVQGNAITGNVVRNGTTGGSARGISLVKAEASVVAGNSIVKCGEYGIVLEQSPRSTVVGNEVDGDSAMPSGLMIWNTSDVVISGNNVHRTTTLGLQLNCYIAMTMNNIVVAGNRFASNAGAAFQMLTSGGGSFGIAVKVLGNLGVGGGNTDGNELLDANRNLRICWGTLSPNVGAASGSMWHIVSAGNAYGVAAALKEGTSDTTGWRFLQGINSGPTANRPSPGSAGYVYFDTDLGREILWDGAAWIDHDGLPAAGKALEATFAWDPGNLADGAGETSADVTVTGAALGDFAIVAAPYDLQGITATAYVSATNTVKVRLQNETGGAIDLASGTWLVRVLQA